jgi:hypothetical protein
MSVVERRPGWRATRIAARAFLGALALVVTTAAASEAAVALGIVALQPSDGGWSGRDVVLVAAAAGLFLAAPLVAGLSFTQLAGAVAPVLTPAALATAAAVVARYLSYDPYYAPYKRRMSEGGALPTWWIILVAGLAILAAVRARRDPGTSLLLAGAAMFLAGPTMIAAGLGH